MEKREFVRFENLPWVVRSYLIFHGVTPESEESPDYDLIREGLSKLCRNHPSLIERCEIYLDTR